MPGLLTAHLVQELIDDRVSAGRARSRRIAAGRERHERQWARVRASLLLSRSEGSSTEGRRV